MPVIRIPAQLLERLAAHAKGFDTPAAVIARLLDTVDGNPENSTPSEALPDIPQRKPALVFDPADEDLFKSQLLEQRQARVVLHKSDGSAERLIWNADRLSDTSNLRANIWSGYLRNWKEKRIVRAEFSLAVNDDA